MAGLMPIGPTGMAAASAAIKPFTAAKQVLSTNSAEDFESAGAGALAARAGATVESINLRMVGILLNRPTKQEGYYP